MGGGKSDFTTETTEDTEKKEGRREKKNQI
jgi:hypothetical protein